MDLAKIKDRVSKFLEANPIASIEELNLSGEPHIAIAKPWGDDSLVLLLDTEDTDDKFFDALNAVYLPERLSALWHTDTNSLEIIWTAYPTRSEVKDRRFVFSFEGTEYECYFGPSSDRLMVIAKLAIPVKQSDTDHRNLLSFFYFHSADGEDRPPFEPEPRSFWIKPVLWNEDAVLRLVNQLNFYMSYYDINSPLIRLHTPKSEEKAVKPRTRYIDGKFPDKIEGRALDDHLLHFWSASLSGDPARRFIYCYRIIEYAAFSYLDHKTRVAVRKILASPNVSSRNDAADQIVSAIQAMKMDDHARFAHFIGDTVDASLIWREISQNLGAFTKETLFDGGFKIGALVSQKSDAEHFINDWPDNFCKAIKNIRNALSHGRDQRTAFPITPTTANFNRLRPWVALTHIAASQVVVYQGIL